MVFFIFFYKDGCVYELIFCSHCLKTNCIGVFIKSTTFENVHLLNKYWIFCEFIDYLVESPSKKFKIKI
jgi:hypothetical protein